MRLREGFDHLERIGKVRSETDAVGRSNDGIFPKTGRPSDFTGLEEVIPHQILCGFTAFGIAVAELRCDLFLKFEGQNVGVPSGIKVQKIAQAMQKLQRLLWNRMPVARLERLSNPAGPMHVAQPTGSVFDIWFELIDRVAELLIPHRLHIS